MEHHKYNVLSLAKIVKEEGIRGLYRGKGYFSVIVSQLSFLKMRLNSSFQYFT
jgi:hypothetical protein